MLICAVPMPSGNLSLLLSAISRGSSANEPSAINRRFLCRKPLPAGVLSFVVFIADGVAPSLVRSIRAVFMPSGNPRRRTESERCFPRSFSSPSSDALLLKTSALGGSSFSGGVSGFRAVISLSTM